jgi:hypothetical protein
MFLVDAKGSQSSITIARPEEETTLLEIQQ